MYIRPSRATTIRPKNGVYQVNARIDPMTHQRLESLQAHYNELTGLSTNTGVIMRRAIRLLSDQIKRLDDDQEEQIIRQCAEGEELPRHRFPGIDKSLNK